MKQIMPSIMGAIWSTIICMISKLTGCPAWVWFDFWLPSFDVQKFKYFYFEIPSMISDQHYTTWSSTTTLLNPFLNSKFSCSGTGFFSLYKCFVDLVVSWFVESCKSCLSFPCTLNDFFKQAIGFSQASSLAGKMMQFR